MTEEIIIDGVNVAWCEFYFEDNGVIAPDGTPERANICTSPEKSCENNDSCYCNKDCYYKQLIRLKQQHNDDTEEIAKLGLDVAILEQENKQMESALKEIKQIIVINKDEFEHCLYHDYDEQILTKINEVLQEDD